MNLTRAVANCVRVRHNFGSLWLECIDDPKRKIMVRTSASSLDDYWIEHYYNSEIRTRMIGTFTTGTTDEYNVIDRFIMGSGLNHFGEWRFYESTRENIQEFIDILKTWLEKPDAEFKEGADV